MTGELVPVRATREEGGALARLVLDRPKANILDRAMIRALGAEVRKLGAERSVKSILFEGAGAHFSFGASVEEHRGDQVAGLLQDFHGLFRDLFRCGKVLMAAVRGQCLGGGLELAAFAQRVFAAPDARLGCPEIRLGVFAPIGALVLPLRMGQPRAEELLLTGRSLGAEDALAARLIDAVAPDPAAAALAWHREFIAPLSAVAVAHTVRAARHLWFREFESLVAALERQYLGELARTADGSEGIAAFLEKRPPQWTHQ